MRVSPAFAKINLALEVTGKRPDGYHDLDSVVTTIDWHDLVSVDVQPASRTEIALQVTGPAGDIASDSSNLAWQAASLLAAASGSEWRIGLAVEKRIPVGAGLGGGSSDAAAVLRLGAALMAQSGRDLPPSALREIAPRLGSDVPVLLFPGTYRVRGRGEILDCLPSAALWVVLVVLGANATGSVFRSVTAPAADGRSGRIGDALLAGDAPAAADFGSALEGAAALAYPEFAGALAALRGSSSLPWHVTGSGGAVFTPAANARQAQDLAKSLQAGGFTARAARTVG